MATGPAVATRQENILFLPGIFNETLQLLLQAHDYFYHFGQEDQSQLETLNRTIYACEMSRITLRLSCVMAWLMVRKAVSTGKITDGEALDKYRLDSTEICLHENREVMGTLPAFMGFLLDESHRIYERIWRLDEQMRSKLDNTETGLL